MDVLAKKSAEELGIQLSQNQIKQFRQYYHEMVDWNERINLTRIVAVEQVEKLHFLDSLATSIAFPKNLLTSGGSVLDIGSGAGFPGLPMKIAFPKLRLTLIDATAKKTSFLKHVVKVLELDGVEIRTGRAEMLAHDRTLREGFEVVLARALAHLAVLAELSLPFCKCEGIVVAQKGDEVKDELNDASNAISEMGGTLKKINYLPAWLGNGKTLVILNKSSTTPNRYPRRPGIPAKRPL